MPSHPTIFINFFLKCKGQERTRGERQEEEGGKKKKEEKGGKGKEEGEGGGKWREEGRGEERQKSKKTGKGIGPNRTHVQGWLYYRVRPFLNLKNIKHEPATSFSFETGSLYVALTILELTRLALIRDLLAYASQVQGSKV